MTSPSSTQAGTRPSRPVQAPVGVEIPWSYARRVDGGVRVVLVLGENAPVRARRLWLRMQLGARSFRVPAERTRTEQGWRLEAELPSSALSPGLWAMRLRVGRSGPLLPVQAVLLIADDQPLALLPGPRPSLRMPARGGSSPY